MPKLFRLGSLVSALVSLSSVLALPTSSSLPSARLDTAVPPVPIVIWHGLGDRYDAPGLLSLASDLQARPDLEGVYIHIIRQGEDGAGDQRATFFGSAQAQIAFACEQLLALPELTDPVLNPSGKFDALGFSQGGQLLRGVVEKCGGEGGLKVRNLITVGSQHMGIDAMPPCPPGSSPFSTCRLMHLSLVREGVYSSWAQSQVVPAQYWREEGRLEDYYRVNTFLKDINNEREGDEQVGSTTARVAEEVPRNSSYKENFESLNRLVLIRFSEDTTVVPAHSSHFTLPHPNATNCPTPPLPTDPFCYSSPLPWSALPLYTHDYVGLRTLKEAGRVTKGVCEGAHMQIGEECWEGIVRWFGKAGEKGPANEDVGEGAGEEVWYQERAGRSEGEFVLQL